MWATKSNNGTPAGWKARRLHDNIVLKACLVTVWLCDSNVCCCTGISTYKVGLLYFNYVRAMINKYKVNCMFIIKNMNCPMFLFWGRKVGQLKEILRRVFCFFFFSHATTDEMNASLFISKLSRCLFCSIPPLCVSCQVPKNPSHASNWPPLLLYLANQMLLSWQDASFTGTVQCCHFLRLPDQLYLG